MKKPNDLSTANLTQTSFVGGMTRTAVFSPCGLFRYELGRVWDKRKSLLVYVLLNPSKADEQEDDPTTRRCIGFAKHGGYGGIHMVNLFGYIATYPDHLRGRTRSGMDCVGPENDAAIVRATGMGRLVAAWGLCPSWAEARVAYVMRSLITPAVTLHALGVTRDGHPRHPLYCPGDSKFEVWTGRPQP